MVRSPVTVCRQARAVTAPALLNVRLPAWVALGPGAVMRMVGLSDDRQSATAVAALPVVCSVSTTQSSGGRPSGARWS